MSPKTLADLSALVNPILLIVLLVLTPLRRSGAARIVRYIGASAVALLVTFLLAHLNRWTHLWEANLYFPSGHTTFLACVSTSIFLLDRRSAFFTVPLAIAYGALLILMKWHTWIDVLAALVFAPPVTILCHSVFADFRVRQQEKPVGA